MNTQILSKIAKLILQEIAKKHKTKYTNSKDYSTKNNQAIGFITYNKVKYYILVYSDAQETFINLQHEMIIDNNKQLSGWLVAYYINNNTIVCGTDSYALPHRAVIKNVSIADPESIRIIVDVFDDVLVKAKINL